MMQYACKRVVSAVIAIGLAFALAGCPPSNVQVTVPNLAGQSQAAATSLLGVAKLTLGTVTEVFHATVPAGQVVGQNPAAGTSVNQGTAVNLTVSKGPEPVTVPDVVGQTQAAAEATITTAGLTVGVVTEAPHGTAPAGEVIGQNPAAGASVAPGTSVDLTVSSGPAMVTVPDVVGMSQAAAEDAFITAGLTLGTATTQYYPTVPRHQIYGQAPAAGAEVAPGSAVNIMISNGNYIKDIAELQKVGNDPGYPLDGTYVLLSDFNATATATWNGGAGFVPIGTQSNPFTGSLDGDGNTITGLHISRPTDSADGNFTGLVGFASGASIENLQLADCSISGHDRVGGLVGYTDGVLSGCSVSGSVSGKSNVGGLAGEIYDASLTSCGSSATVVGLSDQVGGLVGLMWYSSVSMCSASGAVSGTMNVGGLIGWAVNTGSVMESHATGSVTCEDIFAGGLIGYSMASIYQCNASGNVTAPNAAGSFFGGIAGGANGNAIE